MLHVEGRTAVQFQKRSERKRESPADVIEDLNGVVHLLVSLYSQDTQGYTETFKASEGNNLFNRSTPKYFPLR
jgi:hypothetical protein